MSLRLCVPADCARPLEHEWARAFSQAHRASAPDPPTHCHPNLKPLGFRHKPCLFRGGDQWRACGRGPVVEPWWGPLACFAKSVVLLAPGLAPAAPGSSAKPQESQGAPTSSAPGIPFGASLRFLWLPGAPWRRAVSAGLGASSWERRAGSAERSAPRNCQIANLARIVPKATRLPNCQLGANWAEGHAIAKLPIWRQLG